jgi:hypothetical protein
MKGMYTIPAGGMISFSNDGTNPEKTMTKLLPIPNTMDEDSLITETVRNVQKRTG